MTRRRTTPAPVRPYTVLRDARLLGTAEPFAGHAAATAPTAPSPSPLALPGRPRVSVETRTLEPREVGVVARDPSVVGLAPVMPTRLIEPLESAATTAGEASWGIGAVGADRSAFTGEGVLVAVLDTGIDTNHPAFAGVALVEQDYSGDGNGDANGHGTHCAGTVFGRDVEGTRIGVARGVERALIGKVLGNDGRGESDWIYRAISWAVGEGAKVVSMSLGFDYYAAFRWYMDNGYPEPAAVSQALVDYRANLRAFDALMAFAQAHALTTGGVVFAAASGNESERDGSPPYEVAASLPAAATGVVSVGALGRGAAGLRVAPFSNTFPQVSAPGVDIVSARAGGALRPLSGTSMAAPHVAGVAALWWQALPGLGGLANATNVVAELLGGAVTAGFETGTDPADRGAGLVAAP